MNKEYISFHLKEILKDAHQGEVDRAIEWIEEYIERIEKEKK